MDNETKQVYWLVGFTVLLLFSISYSFLITKKEDPKCDEEEFCLTYRTHYPDGMSRIDTIKHVCKQTYLRSENGTNSLVYFTHRESIDWLFSTHDKHTVESTAALEIVSVERQRQ